MALVFAVSNGGVIYTRRFYDDIVENGPRAASPLLFPETVFNAPASHLAAILGITGATYTVIGDGAVGILALKMAEELMEDHRLDHCLVIGTEETDWLLCSAYRRWRLLRTAPPIEPFQEPAKGTILSEGAGAVLLSRTGSVRLERIICGPDFTSQSLAKDSIEAIFSQLCESRVDLVLVSANGTFIDGAEHSAISKHCSRAQILAIKGALGESVGASAFWQIICGAQSLLTQQLPSTLIHSTGQSSDEQSSSSQFHRAIVSVCGLNQQVGGLSLVKNQRNQ
jgi:3-oxoacyl-(acyl-carrier-protein) synthase